MLEVAAKKIAEMAETAKEGIDNLGEDALEVDELPEGMEDCVDNLPDIPEDSDSVIKGITNAVDSSPECSVEKDISQVEKNKQDGIRREEEVQQELKEDFPEPPNKVIREAILRDENGEIVKDPETGTARRIDFVVVGEDGNVTKMVEVTSKTASKDAQMAKENRIRENDGNFIKDPDSGEIIPISDGVQTEIERRA